MQSTAIRGNHASTTGLRKPQDSVSSRKAFSQRFLSSVRTSHPDSRLKCPGRRLSSKDPLANMETITVYAAATSTSTSTAATPIADDPTQPATNSPPAAALADNSASQSSSSQSSDIALWVPIAVVVLLIILGLLSWATKSQRAELHWRADRDPHAPTAIRRNRRTGIEVLASTRDLQRPPDRDPGLRPREP